MELAELRQENDALLKFVLEADTRYMALKDGMGKLLDANNHLITASVVLRRRFNLSEKQRKDIYRKYRALQGRRRRGR